MSLTENGRYKIKLKQSLTNGLVARGVNHVPQNLLGVLYGTPFRVPVPQKHQFGLLTGPQPSDALAVDTDQSETQ